MFRESRRRLWLQVGVVLGSILSITVLHETIPHHSVFWHSLFQRLYYIPVVYAAAYFGLRGSLAAAALSTLGYAPHFMWASSDSAASLPNQYAEVVVLFMVGVVTGILADRERQRSQQLKAAMDELRGTHVKLRTTIEHLKRSNRLSAVGEVSTSLAHEIRNPLANIRGAVDILDEQGLDEGTRVEFTQILKKECARLERLLSHLLDLARGPNRPNYREVDVRDALDSFVALAAPMAAKGGVAIRKEIAPQTAKTIQCDPEQLHQVLLNLTLNAVQAMQEGGEVVLRVREQNSDLLIEVRDQGCGIEGADLERIFDPFFTTKEKGTGVGLLVVHQIVSQHGGRMKVESNAGKGTTFTVVLPIRGRMNGTDFATVSEGAFS